MIAEISGAGMLWPFLVFFAERVPFFKDFLSRMHCSTVKEVIYIVASELKDPICHSDECQIGSFSSEATI